MSSQGWVLALAVLLATSTAVAEESLNKTNENIYLICKARKNRFHYSWSAGSLASGQDMIDQNNVRYDFRSASQPAGETGENLKVGECGLAEEALAKNTKRSRSQVTFQSLSDEATQTFYKLKTGKVFKVPVRHTKNGLIAAPGGITVLR